MRAVAQRVCTARVEVDRQIVGEIARGLLVYLAAGKRDQPGDPTWMADKLAGLRVFADEQGKMSRSVIDVQGEVLVVSQFTLYGDTRRGRRPSFDDAALPEPAERAYDEVCSALRSLGIRLATGQFRAMMQVHAIVDGPVTILIDSERVF
jgi:D-tyrosyl-tRNA(Tyr) deacylase